MTRSHVLPAGKCSVPSLTQPALLPLMYASQVSVGDCIMTVSGQERVLTVENVPGEGLYTIVTNQVSGVSNLLSYSSLRPVLFLFLSLPLYSKCLLPSKPLTLSQEYLVVNDIIASPFGVSHMMANLYYNIHRIVYATAPKLLSYPWLNRANEVSPSSDSVVP
jgi:hypothetical protein